MQGSTIPQAAPAPTSGTLQLDRWARELAPLSDGERGSVNRLADWINRSLHAGKHGKPHDDVVQGPAEEEERSFSPAEGKDASDLHDHDAQGRPSLPSAPILDAPAFLSWYNAQRSHLASSSSASHQDTFRALSDSRRRADDTLGQLDAAKVHVAELRAGAKFVQEGSEGLREEAESMVEQMVCMRSGLRMW